MNVIELIVSDCFCNADCDKIKHQKVFKEIERDMSLWEKFYAEIEYSSFVEEEALYWEDISYGM